MSNDKRNSIGWWGLVIIMVGFIFFCCVAGFIYFLRTATPDVWVEVCMLVAFVVIGLVILWQMAGRKE